MAPGGLTLPRNEGKAHGLQEDAIGKIPEGPHEWPEQAGTCCGKTAVLMPTLDTCGQCIPASCSPEEGTCLLCKAMEAPVQPDLGATDGLFLVVRTIVQERDLRS